MEQIDAAFNTSDLDGLVALYTSDTVQMPPEEPVVIGKEAIRSRGEPLFAESNYQLSSVVEDIQVSGDWAFLRMSYNMSSTPKDGGDTTTEVGKWVLFCQRQTDGSWKIANDTWNTDAPINRD